VFTLDFFPVTVPTSNDVRDAWTDVAFGDWSYTASNKTFTLTGNVEDAPNQLLVSYNGYLGTATGFTNDTFEVLPLTNADALAGLPVDEAFLNQIRDAVEGILPKYLNTATNGCVPLTLATLLAAAGNMTGQWSPVTNGLVTAAHFNELTTALDQMTAEDECSCLRVVAFICEGRIGNAASQPNWWEGDFEADITHTNTGAPLVTGHFPWYDSASVPLEILYDATTRQVSFLLHTNVNLSMSVRDGVFSNETGAVGNLVMRMAAHKPNSWTSLDTVQVELTGTGTTNTLGSLSITYEGGRVAVMTVTNLPLQAGFRLTGHAQFGWSSGDLPERSHLNFQFTFDEAL
jgi:hypothetical protein